MHVVAVSWQVYQLTRNPLALGGIGVARIVPLVLLALGSGVLADALDRRKLMLFSQIAMMLCSAVPGAGKLAWFRLDLVDLRGHRPLVGCPHFGYAGASSDRSQPGTP